MELLLISTKFSRSYDCHHLAHTLKFMHSWASLCIIDGSFRTLPLSPRRSTLFSGKMPCLPGPPKQKTHSMISNIHWRLHQFSCDQISRKNLPYSPMQALLASGLYLSKKTMLSLMQAAEPGELNKNTGRHNWSVL